MQLAARLDSHALKAVHRMSVHEFVTITAFYLESLPDSVCSKPLAMALLTKTQEAVTDFNEMQLHLLKTTLEMMFRKERGKY